jgi:hypothetical protein
MAFGEKELLASRRVTGGRSFNRWGMKAVNIYHQFIQPGCGQLERRHARRGNSIADNVAQFRDRVDARSLSAHERRPALTARAAGAMTSGAQRAEAPLAGLRTLAIEPGRGKQGQNANANSECHAIIL